jgi:hypothetical protein
MNIPAAALEAGARAIAVDGGIADPEWRFYKEAARAAFRAMIEAWPGALEQQFYELTADGRRLTFPVIVLPLPTETSDE